MDAPGFSSTSTSDAIEIAGVVKKQDIKINDKPPFVRPTKRVQSAFYSAFGTWPPARQNLQANLFSADGSINELLTNDEYFCVAEVVGNLFHEPPMVVTAIGTVVRAYQIPMAHDEREPLWSVYVSHEQHSPSRLTNFTNIYLGWKFSPLPFHNLPSAGDRLSFRGNLTDYNEISGLLTVEATASILYPKPAQ